MYCLTCLDGLFLMALGSVRSRNRYNDKNRYVHRNQHRHIFPVDKAYIDPARVPSSSWNFQGFPCGNWIWDHLDVIFPVLKGGSCREIFDNPCRSLPFLFHRRIPGSYIPTLNDAFDCGLRMHTPGMISDRRGKHHTRPRKGPIQLESEFSKSGFKYGLNYWFSILSLF